VAYVETAWYRAAAPASDAITSTLSGVGALPPLVIVPDRQRRRDERFRSIIEHEFVHINQAIVGTLMPSPRGSGAQRVASVFFSRFRNEFEAHLLQLVRWPRLFPHRLGLSLEHWCVLRGYTDALQAILLATWRRQFSPQDLLVFLDRLPRRLPRWLEELGVDDALAASLRRDLSLHVAIALLTLDATRPSFGRSAVFRTGKAWVRSTPWPWQGRGDVDETSTRSRGSGDAEVEDAEDHVGPPGRRRAEPHSGGVPIRRDAERLQILHRDRVRLR
jgi:hypothetical protein